MCLTGSQRVQNKQSQWESFVGSLAAAVVPMVICIQLTALHRDLCNHMMEKEDLSEQFHSIDSKLMTTISQRITKQTW